MAADPIHPPAPQADRHLLGLHALRYRQLRTAFLHGRRRNWRDRRRIWPAVLTAVVLIAVVVAATCVLAAFDRQQTMDPSAQVGPGASAISPAPTPPSGTGRASR
jgi:hypothetical protein